MLFRSDISNNNYNSGFNIMESDIDKNNVILAGEGYAVAKNYGFELALLKQLNQKDKIRYLLAETGYSSSCYIDEYLIEKYTDNFKSNNNNNMLVTI